MDREETDKACTISKNGQKAASPENVKVISTTII